MNLALRLTTPDDDPFLYHLFRAVRGPAFLAWGLPPDQLDPLLRMQFQAQSVSYRAAYPDSSHSLVLTESTPVGRLWIDRSATRLHLLDISILPAFQSRGIGSALLAGLIAEARAAAVPVTSDVAHDNPGSLRFHQRLGFAVVSRDQLYSHLELRP